MSKEKKVEIVDGLEYVDADLAVVNFYDNKFHFVFAKRNMAENDEVKSIEVVSKIRGSEECLSHLISGITECINEIDEGDEE